MNYTCLIPMNNLQVNRDNSIRWVTWVSIDIQNTYFFICNIYYLNINISWGLKITCIIGLGLGYNLYALTYIYAAQVAPKLPKQSKVNFSLQIYIVYKIVTKVYLGILINSLRWRICLIIVWIHYNIVNFFDIWIIL